MEKLDHLNVRSSDARGRGRRGECGKSRIKRNINRKKRVELKEGKEGKEGKRKKEKRGIIWCNIYGRAAESDR